MAFDEEPQDIHGECRYEINRLERMIKAAAPLGFWMAAALSDPKVSFEMKIAIEPFLELVGPFVGDRT